MIVYQNGTKLHATTFKWIAVRYRRIGCVQIMTNFESIVMLCNISSNARPAFQSNTTENRIVATAMANRAAEQKVDSPSNGIARNGSPQPLRVSPHQVKIMALQEALTRGNAQNVARPYVSLGRALSPTERVTIRDNGTAVSLQKKIATSLH